MRSCNFHSMNFPQIWYKDSFRVPDMNCSKNKIGVTESATRMRTSARALPEFDLLNVCTKHDLGNKVCEFRDTLVGNVSSYMKEKKSFPEVGFVNRTIRFSKLFIYTRQ